MSSTSAVKMISNLTTLSTSSLAPTIWRNFALLVVSGLIFAQSPEGVKVGKILARFRVGIASASIATTSMLQKVHGLGRPLN